MVHDGGHPFIRPGVLRDGEAADRSLASVLVAVEQIDQEDITASEASFDTCPVGIVGHPYGCLPIAQVVWWRVEIAGLRAERGRIRTDHLRLGQHLSRDALGLMSCPASTLQPSMTAIPVPTFCSDIAM